VNLDRLRKAHPSDKDYLNAVQAQYLQFLEERRVLDQLGWTAFGLGLAVSSATAGLLITAQVPGLGGWPRILGMVFSIVLYWFGFWLLHLTRKTRRIHRVLGMAIEEVTGWFHLALTETANRPIRKEVNLYIKWFTWIYMVGLSVAVTWIILAEII
jgi:hypothetical protein